MEISNIEDEITCPYCSTQYTDDSYDYDESDTLECDNCGKFFDYRRVTTIDYRAEANCEANKESHVWKTHVGKDSQTSYHCKVCRHCVLDKPQDYTPPAESKAGD